MENPNKSVGGNNSAGRNFGEYLIKVNIVDFLLIVTFSASAKFP